MTVRLFPAEEFYCYRDAVIEAIRQRSQFNIIHYESGIKVDVFIPEPGFSGEALLRVDGESRSCPVLTLGSLLPRT